MAKTLRVKADVLVLEGWLPDYAIESAIVEFREGSYQKLITIGGSLPRGFYLLEHKNFAELAAATLIALGLEREKILIVSDSCQLQGRTHNSAETLNQWLSASEVQIQAFNLYTLGSHARRSWIIFKEVIEPKILVGVISTEPLNYDAKSWWKSSEGFRTVVSELLAYLYVRVFKLN